MLIALDACQDAARVFAAYNDGSGVTARFTLNGLKHANKLLDKNAFDASKWKTYGKFDAADGRHQAFVSPHVDVEVEGMLIRSGEAVRIEESYKYSPTQAAQLWKESGVVEITAWLNRTSDYGQSADQTTASILILRRSTSCRQSINVRVKA